MLTSFIKNAKTANEINKKREEASNLFGLGLVSLIAACSSDDLNAGAGNDEIPIDDDVIDTSDPLPFKALTVSDISMAESGFAVTTGGNSSSFIVELSDSTGTTKTLNFAEGESESENKAKIYQLTDTGKYDLVISLFTIDRNEEIGTTNVDNPEYQKGRVFIYWDVAKFTDKDSTHLEIKGANTSDRIGTFAPDFLQLGGVAGDKKLDMVIRSASVDAPIVGNPDTRDEGAMYILWDVVDYTATTKTIDLGSLAADITDNGVAISTAATAGSLAIYGGKQRDDIGSYAPNFLQLGGNEGEEKYDMVIRSKYVDNEGDGRTNYTNEGAIFILWDVADYYNTASLHHTIFLDFSATATGEATGATFGSLAIYGAQPGDNIGVHAPEFLQLGGVAGDNKMDMVISSEGVDTSAANAGAIFVLWDVADYYNTVSLHHTITLDSSATATGEATGATFGSLAIYGGKTSDYLGKYVPEFLQIGGKDDNYDMVIRSAEVDKFSATAGTSEGAMFILWDVADYYSTDTASLHHTIALDSSATGATSGSLAIYGARHLDQIGSRAPEFLHIGGKDDNHDMVIRERNADKSGTGGATDEGAIYILWDVADYHSTDPASLHHTINLDSNVTGEATGATSGSLTIYGARPDNIIGDRPLEFLHMGGKDDNYDMVISSFGIDKFSPTAHTNHGAVFVLWDVADYYSTDPATVNQTIVIDAYVTDATSGSLAIHGARNFDYVGFNAPELLQIGGKDDNYDMVIRSAIVDKSGVGLGNDEGAIYVLWDVADYYSTDPADVNKAIDLAVAADATSGLLTIYGKVNGERLGNDFSNVLYGSDDDGNKVLTNVDKGHAGDNGKNDIVFQDDDYTYILFGDKVATTGSDTEVDSKTVDLSVVHASMAANTADFFSYDFGSGSVDKVGYRFADRRHTTLADVQVDFPDPSSPLSDADSGVGAWDIA